MTKSLLNLYFYSHDPTNAVSFTEVDTRPVFAAKGPFPVLAKCWRAYYLGVTLPQEKNISVPLIALNTSCLCFPLHVTTTIYNRIWLSTLCKSKWALWYYSQAWRDSVEIHKELRKAKMYRKGQDSWVSCRSLQSSLTIQAKQLSSCSTEILVSAPRQSTLHNSETVGGDTSTNHTTGSAHWSADWTEQTKSVSGSCVSTSSTRIQ